MTISLDSLFSQGSGHKVCEDFALHGADPFPFAIVSDGCSGSPYTDVGARMLTLAARKTLKNIGLAQLRALTAEQLGDCIISEARASVGFMGVPEVVLDATLMLAYLDPEQEQVRVLMYGDGSVTWSTRDGCIKHWATVYPSGLPEYLNYRLKPGLLEQFAQESEGEELQVWRSTLGTEPECEILPLGFWVELNLPLSELRWLFVASDGLDTYYQVVDKVNDPRPDIVPVATPAILAQLTGFKNFKGTFLERRFNRMCKTLKTDGIDHEDDVSVAGMAFYPGGEV